MLYVESGTFNRDDSNIGYIAILHRPITLIDDIPVQRAYSAILDPLLNEVKGYIQDLFVKDKFLDQSHHTPLQ